MIETSNPFSFNKFKDRYIIFSGLDDVALESILLGCTGWISGLVDAFPRENGLMWDAATSGNWDKALEIYRWYMPMLHFDSHPKLVQYIKLASAEMGYGTETVRAPRLPLIGEQREEEIARHLLAVSRKRGGGEEADQQRRHAGRCQVRGVDHLFDELDHVERAKQLLGGPK